MKANITNQIHGILQDMERKYLSLVHFNQFNFDKLTSSNRIEMDFLSNITGQYLTILLFWKGSSYQGPISALFRYEVFISSVNIVLLKCSSFTSQQLYFKIRDKKFTQKGNLLKTGTYIIQFILEKTFITLAHDVTTEKRTRDDEYENEGSHKLRQVASRSQKKLIQ